MPGADLPDKRLEPRQMPEFERKIASLERSSLSHIETVGASTTTIAIPLPAGYTSDDVRWERVKFKGKTGLLLSLRQE
jgi:hypothetical protein